jgi:hypothetical protein
MLLERLGSAVVRLQRTDLAMPGHLPDAENIGAMVQSRRDKAGP